MPYGACRLLRAYATTGARRPGPASAAGLRSPGGDTPLRYPSPVLVDTVLPPDACVAVLRPQRVGAGDPTTALDESGFWRASATPHGPGTLHVRWSASGVEAEAWGPGRRWLLDRVAGLLGADDDPRPFASGHPAVLRAQSQHRWHRIGRSRRLHHALVATILGQRVTAREAAVSWARLCTATGDVAPGPRPLLIAPPPQVLVRKPYWWFHRFGVERKRADALHEVAARAELIEELDEAGDAGRARSTLGRIPGVGPWTVGTVLPLCFGDPDAVPVGDFWVRHMACWALSGERRGSDERMLELLAPYAGQRWRALSLLHADGWSAPRLAPGRRLTDIRRL